MIKVGLTGNRYSGKDVIARIFEQVKVPVFNADAILKFILQYKTDIDSDIKVQLGSSVFLNDGFLDPKKFNTTEKFNRLIEVVESDLFKAYDKFILKNKSSVYTIFHSSILFEKGWDKKMDHSISVFAPKDIRIGRCKKITNMSLQNAYDYMTGECDDLYKNQKATYVVHNYDDAVIGLTAQVDQIDRSIVDKYLKNKQTIRVTGDNNSSSLIKNIMS